MDFTDKVVVITGGSKGFGEGLAKALKERNAKIIVASIDNAALSKTARKLDIDSFPCDVASFDEVNALANHAINKFGRIDMWINNAGVQIAPSNVEDVDLQKLHKLFEVNFFGYFYGCKAVLPTMRKQNSGMIVNINSTAGLEHLVLIL
jgi:NAD(P)-dependent dehydrogenase (short-subunit alcohol dehydrogenase family)